MDSGTKVGISALNEAYTMTARAQLAALKPKVVWTDKAFLRMDAATYPYLFPAEADRAIMGSVTAG